MWLSRVIMVLPQFPGSAPSFPLFPPIPGCRPLSERSANPSSATRSSWGRPDSRLTGFLGCGRRAVVQGLADQASLPLRLPRPLLEARRGVLLSASARIGGESLRYLRTLLQSVEGAPHRAFQGLGLPGEHALRSVGVAHPAPEPQDLLVLDLPQRPLALRASVGRRVPTLRNRASAASRCRSPSIRIPGVPVLNQQGAIRAQMGAAFRTLL
jgi:hypothetical protein